MSPEGRAGREAGRPERGREELVQRERTAVHLSTPTEVKKDKGLGGEDMESVSAFNKYKT